RHRQTTGRAHPVLAALAGTARAQTTGALHTMNILRNVSRLALLALLPLLTLPAGCQFDQATLDTAMRTTQQVIAAQSGASREDTIAAGLKEALSIGSERAAKTLSKTGGYGDN